ncbi:MAG: hypothetical protein EOP04_31050 [Proteobacteria bacterium]|nr:MAG: hypothetical protein EOP04_31050 [Pseudomonadota bacterium]
MRKISRTVGVLSGGLLVYIAGLVCMTGVDLSQTQSKIEFYIFNALVLSGVIFFLAKVWLRRPDQKGN